MTWRPLIKNPTPNLSFNFIFFLYHITAPWSGSLSPQIPYTLSGIVPCFVLVSLHGDKCKCTVYRWLLHCLLTLSDFFFFFFISLIADGPHHYHPACGHKGSSHLSPVHALGPVLTMFGKSKSEKIKIGKNQNQNWVLIGRGSKPPDYASLFFGNRCQTKEVPRDLMFIFRKINIGGVHLIEGFPNATRQRPEHSRVTTAARRQTAPPHNTHNFCWHGPRQRSHGEGNRQFYQLVVGTGATSGAGLCRRRYNPKGDGCYLSTDRLRMCNVYR